MNKPSLLLICVGVLASACASALVRPLVGAMFAPSINQQIIDACETINKECPKMADQYTRLDSATAGEMQITYNYTLMNLKLNQQQVAKMFQVVEPQVTENVRANPQTKVLLDKGITMTYRYSNDKGVLLKEFSVIK